MFQESFLRMKWPKHYRIQMHWAVDLLWADELLTVRDALVLDIKIAVSCWIGIKTPSTKPVLPMQCTASHQDTKLGESKKSVAPEKMPVCLCKAAFSTMQWNQNRTPCLVPCLIRPKKYTISSSFYVNAVQNVIRFKMYQNFESVTCRDTWL